MTLNPLPVSGTTLNLTPQSVRDLTRLLYLVAFGERIAAQCAHWQATTTFDARERRFFRAQSRHERFHAWLFQQTAHWLKPDLSPRTGEFSGLLEYRRELASAMARGRWIEVLVGQQLVLEGLGAVVLKNLDLNMTQQQLGFGRLRGLVLRQERAHHQFGLQLLDSELQARRTDTGILYGLAAPYLDLAEQTLTEASPLLDSLKEDAERYREELRLGLPAWATGKRP